MNFQKKLIQLFKTFVQKNFLSNLRKNDASFLQWNKFAFILNSQPLNLTELEYYVDTFQNTNTNVFKMGLQKKDSFKDASNTFFSKKRQDSGGKQFSGSPTPETNFNGGFNPSKTFGGQRAKGMFPLKGQFDDFGQSHTPTTRKQRKQSYNMKKDPFQKTTNNAQTILNSLEKLFENFMQNQRKIESFQPVLGISNNNINGNLQNNLNGMNNNNGYHFSVNGNYQLNTLGSIGNNLYEYKNQY